MRIEGGVLCCFGSSGLDVVSTSGVSESKITGEQSHEQDLRDIRERPEPSDARHGILSSP